MTSRSTGVERVAELIEAARAVADPHGSLGRATRAELAVSTGLSPAGIELAFEHALETSLSAAQIQAFCSTVSAATAAWILLPSNVFVATLRAIALGLAASPRVLVRTSRREPYFARRLLEAAPGLFTLVETLVPSRGDVLWAYGTDTTLGEVRSTLAPGVLVHAGGPGFGVAVLDAESATPDAASALALDMVLFEQRGCLSPRAAIIRGELFAAERFARFLAAALVELETKVPRGRPADGELADARAFHDTASYAGGVVPAGSGAVAVTARSELVLAPAGRNLWIHAASDPLPLLLPHAAELTVLGHAGTAELRRSVAAALPAVRHTELGHMQRPAFDGPADWRARRATPVA